MPQLLLELLSEEIPARMQPGAQRDLARMAGERLKAAGLKFEDLRTFAGPRRLTLVVDGLPHLQGDRAEERKGPRVGAPEAAMAGFLRSTGLTQEQLVERDGVWFATITHKGQPTADLIAQMVPEIVRAFPWPKAMTWGVGRLKWVRPLQGMLCVFDRAVVPFEIEGLKSGDLTEGHRFMSDGRPFAARDFEAYETGLAERFVVLDAEARKTRIHTAATKLCRANNLELVEDAGLLEEVAGLTEWPVPLLGEMEPEFLDLPPEVIRTSMRTHLRYFAVQNPATGKLAARFLVVANVETTDGGKLVAVGNARVLSARLKDARFFWDEDRRAGFEAWLAKLKGVTFHAKLGTMAERVARLEVLAEALAPVVSAEPKRAREAARLAKADLASAMVGEFPELQGVMGAYYATEAGLPPQVAEAIGEQYKPAGPNDTVPDSQVSMAVALADKLDTLVGFYAIGEKPTGSRDPYALRRAALGVIRILQGSDIRLPIRRAVREWYLSLKTFAAPGRAVYASSGRTTGWLGVDQDGEGDAVAAYIEEFDAALTTEAVAVVAVKEDRAIEFDRSALVSRPPHQPVLLKFRGADEVTGEVLWFLAERLKVQLREEGRRHDLVDAVLALGDDDLVRVTRQVEALEHFLATDDGANLLAGHKRASNILESESKKGRDVPEGTPQALAGAPEEEAALIRALNVARPLVERALPAGDFTVAMSALAGLRAPVDAFFDKVLVNSEVAAERANRLKLLGQVRWLMDQVADFSQVSG